MAEQQDVAEDLLSYATYLVKRLVRAHSLEWDHARVEDAAQALFLAGWQVWRNERNIALAKNRMKSRRVNLLRDFFNQRKREKQFPEPSKARSEPMQPGDLWNENSVRDRQAKSKFGRLRDDPSEEASKNDYIDQLPQRQRQILLLRSVGYTDQQIADELGVSLRTVERERSLLRKEYRNEHED
jgi:DNA-directed RNA polymerase specialized sigma24 family protein